MTSFLEGLNLKEPKKLPGNRVVMELKKRYYGVFEDLSEVYIHRNSLPDLIAYLENRNIPREYVQVVDIPVPVPATAHYDMFEKFVLRDYQELIVADILRPEYHSARVDLQTGKGKAQPLDARIKVPGGWKRMGDIQVGDKVISRDGSITDVDGVFPQGKKPIYRIVFADGRSTECCGEHLWTVYYVNTSKNARWRTVNTYELIRMLQMPNPRVYVPLCEAENVPDVELKIAPYTMGALLGDGGLTGTGIIFSTADEELVDNIRSELPDVLQIRHKDAYDYYITNPAGGAGCNPYTTALRDYGLKGCDSVSKFIPEDYMRGSTKQKFELIQGLFDTDGTVQKSGSVTYCSTSYTLARQVQTLIRSLGGIATIRSRTNSYTYSGEKRFGQEAYEVDIRFKVPSMLFKLKRKLDRINDDNQYSSKLKLRITSINAVGSKEAQCISVTHPEHLYITDEYIVTHNTLCSLAALARKGVRCVVMVPPKYFGIWIKALKETYKGYEDSMEKWMTVSGSAELQKLIDRGIENDLEGVDVIVISNITYRSYIDNYEKYGSKITELGFNCPPPRFHEAIAAGMQINDEIQEDPGLVFRIDMYTNISLQVYLSATPFTGNAYVTKMIDKMLPAETMVRLPNLDVYINVMCLRYCEPSIKPKDYLTPFKNTYNHARYETQMMKDRKRLMAYKSMVGNITKGVFVNDQLPNQKLLLLCATVAFIDEIVNYLKERFPDLQINGHYSGSPFERLQKNDITVSTIKSSGTGVDIHNLREVGLLQATDSKKDNIQILGRLRKLKDYPDVVPRLTFLACETIPHSMRYAQNKRDHFDGRVLNFKTMRISM